MFGFNLTFLRKCTNKAETYKLFNSHRKIDILKASENCAALFQVKHCC